MLECINLEMSLHKPNTTDRFDTIENHMLNLKAMKIFKNGAQKKRRKWK